MPGKSPLVNSPSKSPHQIPPGKLPPGELPPGSGLGLGVGLGNLTRWKFTEGQFTRGKFGQVVIDRGQLTGGGGEFDREDIRGELTRGGFS